MANFLTLHWTQKTTLTLDRFAVASFTREITLRRALPTPSIDKIPNRFIHAQIL